MGNSPFLITCLLGEKVIKGYYWKKYNVISKIMEDKYFNRIMLMM